MTITNILADICAKKAEWVAASKSRVPMADISKRALDMPQPRGFKAALAHTAKTNTPAIIAEIKKTSPSKGRLREDFAPALHAQAYAKAGASCLSVLTDGPYFEGTDEDLIAARTACTLPALRKDFMIDPYQIIEARALGADCILIIMAALDDKTAQQLVDTAHDWQLDILIEVHDAPELERALRLDAPHAMIGVNNRNLKTLHVDLATSHTLIRQIPHERMAVAESGLSTLADIKNLQNAGFSAFLIGERFMTQPDPGHALLTMLAERS